MWKERSNRGRYILALIEREQLRNGTIEKDIVLSQWYEWVLEVDGTDVSFLHILYTHSNNCFPHSWHQGNWPAWQSWKNFTDGLCGIVTWHMGQRCLIVLIINNKLVLAFLKFILLNVMLKHSTILIQIYYFNLMRVRKSYVSDLAMPCKLHQLKFLKPLGTHQCPSIISCLLTGREKLLARDWRCLNWFKHFGYP